MNYYTMLSEVDINENLLANEYILGVDSSGDVIRVPQTTINKIKTVNNVEPDENGNIKVETDGVKTINGVKPDEIGNISLFTGSIILNVDTFVPIDFNNNIQTYENYSIDELRELAKSGIPIQVMKTQISNDATFIDLYQLQNYREFDMNELATSAGVSGEFEPLKVLVFASANSNLTYSEDGMELFSVDVTPSIICVSNYGYFDGHWSW